MNQSPTPWTDNSDNPESEELASIRDAEGHEVVQACGCCNSPCIHPDNRAFIVRACNAHDELLTRLKALSVWIENYVTEDADGYHAELKLTQDIIDKAEGR